MTRLVALAFWLAAQEPAAPPPPPPPDALPSQAAAPALQPPLSQAVEQEPRPVVKVPAHPVLGTVAGPGGPAGPGGVVGRRVEPGPRYHAFSVYDAATLDNNQVAVAVALGFPYAMIRGAYGLSESLDVGAGFNSMYGQVNQPLVFGKLRLKGDKTSNFAMAVRLDLEMAFFRQTASAEGERGSRWITGQRDFSVHPGLVLSTRTSRGLVFYGDVGVQVTLDTHPRSGGPLTGPPPAATFGANVPLRMGVDLPLSNHLSFLAGFGVDLHFRPEDSTAMPYLELGVTFGG